MVAKATVDKLHQLSLQIAIKDSAREQIVDSDACCRALVMHAPAIRSLFARMVLSCTESTNSDPFTREGDPQAQYQDMFCEQGSRERAERETVCLKLGAEQLPLSTNCCL